MNKTPSPIQLADDGAIARAATVLRRGGVVAFPTETVYGLGVDALNVNAVAKVFEIKGRPRFDPLIVHVPDIAAARTLVADWPPLAEELATRFWPGPLTLVLPRVMPDNHHTPTTATTATEPRVIPDLVTAGLPTVALRVPDHHVALQLLEAARTPIAAPSANRFSRISPTQATHVFEELGDAVDMILDGGPCRGGLESTVLSLVQPQQPTILRIGGLAVEALEAAAGCPITIAQRHIDTNDPAAAARGLASPGMLSRHYAPQTPLQLLEPALLPQTIAKLHQQQITRIGLLCLQTGQINVQPFTMVRALSETGDLHEAAANLFACLRRLDAADLQIILACPVPEQALGRAINDRLQRAAQHRAPGESQPNDTVK